MKKRIFSLLLAALMILSLAACGSSGGGSSSSGSGDGSSSTSEPSGSGSDSSGGSSSSGSGYDLSEGDYVIGLSNSFYGNTWRRQMVDSFTEAAEEAKSSGYISDYEIQNGDNTVNTQIAQINSFILSGVDAICINAASSTALNDVIQSAMDMGIVIVAFDSIIDLEGAYTMDYDWVSMGERKTEYVMDAIGGEGNVVIVRGVSARLPTPASTRAS